jgi:hypothetical protein
MVWLKQFSFHVKTWIIATTEIYNPNTYMQHKSIALTHIYNINQYPNTYIEQKSIPLTHIYNRNLYPCVRISISVLYMC